MIHREEEVYLTMPANDSAAHPVSDTWEVLVVPTELSTPVELVGRDRSRLRLQIVNTGGNVVVINASREALASPAEGLHVPPGGSLALDTTAAVWAMSATTPAGGGSSEVSVLIERCEAPA